MGREYSADERMSSPKMPAKFGPLTVALSERSLRTAYIRASEEGWPLAQTRDEKTQRSERLQGRLCSSAGARREDMSRSA